MERLKMFRPATEMRELSKQSLAKKELDDLREIKGYIQARIKSRAANGHSTLILRVYDADHLETHAIGKLIHEDSIMKKELIELGYKVVPKSVRGFDIVEISW